MRKKKYIQQVETYFKPLLIPVMQEVINTQPMKIAASSQIKRDCGTPKAASKPAPICIKPTPMEFDVAPMMQKMTTAVSSVLSQGIFLPIAHSMMELKERDFLRLKQITAKAAPQMAYMQYWTKLQSHMAWATAKIAASREPAVPTAVGVVMKWYMGSPIAQNRRPVPMPEQMDMAHQMGML